MGYIYLVTNLVNDKKYIGQTTLTAQERWNTHISAALNHYDDFYFHRAIVKYGIENFKLTILEQCPDCELDTREQYYIEKYETFYIYNKGYNLTRGGSGTTKVNSEKILQMWNEGQSAIEIARYFGFYIRTVTDVLKRNAISQKEIYSRSMKYGARFRYKKIFQYNLLGELINVYNDLNEMSKITGYRKDYISAACRHTYPSANGYLWLYEDEEKSIPELLAAIPKDNSQPVLQYDSYGNFIAEYPSFNSAAMAVGCDKTLIAHAAKEISATAKGYFWKLKNSDIDIYNKIQAFNNRYNNKKRKVIQYDLQDNIINEYESVTEAAQALGKPNLRSAIGRVCAGKQNTSGGYKWAYAKT